MNSPETTQLAPKEILTPDRFVEYEQTIIGSERVACALELITRDGLDILDIGGASGVFLNELKTKSKHRSRLFNLEVDDTYENQQISKDIHFINGSIINSSLDNERFDLVTLRHILHHLVGPDLKTTRANQQRALQEVFRITKKGGYILVEEEVNDIKLFSRIVYVLSKLANKYKLRNQAFDAGTVIVSFMTPVEIAKVLQELPLEILRQSYVRWNMPLRWKLTLLMSRVGHVLWVAKKL
jgi:SAM-dependent methyltransferase